MKRGEGMLLAAGVAGVVSLMFASASVVIAIMSAARPPVSEYLGAVENARLAHNASNAWMWPTAVMAFSVAAMAQIVLRRLLLTTSARIRPWHVSNGAIATMCALTALGGLLLADSLWNGVQALRVSGGSAGAEGFALYGSVSAVSSAAAICALLSSTLFLRWWKDRQSDSPESGAIG